MTRAVKRHVHQSPLFSGGFLEVKRKKLVETYNACLRMINLPPTKRTSFRIDIWGWSPEIADDLGDEFYLSQNGPSNPYAIIVTPEQEQCKLHFPYYSFDEDLIKNVFATYRAPIADITTQQGIVMTVDQRISQYQNPFDLLLIDHFNIDFRATGGIIKAAKAQRELVHQLYNDDGAWKEFDIYEQLVDSSKSHGDLRYRSVEMEGMPYNRMSSFYTKAFGGVFVFRGLPSKQPLMVFEDEAFMSETPSNSIRALHIRKTEELLTILLKEELVEFNRTNRQKLIDKLTRATQCQFTKAFAEGYPDNDVIDYNQQGYRSFENDLIKRALLDQHYRDLRHATDLLQRDMLTSIGEYSSAMRLQLFLPFPWHQPELKEVVELLLLKMNPMDYLALYEWDEEAFFEQFMQWPETLQRYVEDLLS